MSSFIPQLLIISALGLMVQTAPTRICPTKRLTGANLKERLKSAARALNDARKSSPEVEIRYCSDATSQSSASDERSTRRITESHSP